MDNIRISELFSVKKSIFLKKIKILSAAANYQKLNLTQLMNFVWYSLNIIMILIGANLKALYSLN